MEGGLATTSPHSHDDCKKNIIDSQCLKDLQSSNSGWNKQHASSCRRCTVVPSFNGSCQETNVDGKCN